MSAKKNSRHAPPSTNILLARMDRKLNRLLSVTETMLPHWRRLIEEKEILHGQVDTLVAENAVLRKNQCKCPPTAANGFMAEPLGAAEPLTPIPVLANEFHKNVEPEPSTSPAHVYSKGGRCLRCDRLRVAIEASDLPCTDLFGDTA